MEILEFIENFKYGLGQFTKKESGIVQQLFENGFCYYFAKILKDAFPGGELCIPWPIGHFVYKYNDKYWDISGEYIPKQHDCVAMVPLNHKYFIDDSFIRCIENGFMHNGYSKNEYIFCKNLTQKEIEEADWKLTRECMIKNTTYGVGIDIKSLKVISNLK